MLTIAGCQVTAQLSESNNSLVYRGYRLADEQPAILKMLKEAYPTPERQGAFKREYEIMRCLNCQGVVKAYSWETGEQQRPIVVLEDFGGESLAALEIAGKLSLKDFLDLGISLTEALSELHGNNIIHQDVNSFNIVLNPVTKIVKLIDFSLARADSINFSPPEQNHLWPGTAAYMSPEQTGRINRLIDLRTDFYSLGVTFYQLLTGQLPFEGNDFLELVHCHIAKKPIPPHQINPEIPEVISSIVMKMLAKDPEDRYQSAWGILADLVICLIQLESGNKIQYIIPGEYDISEKFNLSQKLYGRDRESKTLINDLEKLVSHKARILPLPKTPQTMILVTGDAGVGKSAFAQELCKQITKKRGYFLSGKALPDVPYSALIAAFQTLLKQLLSESETKLSEWRKKLQVALGKNARIMIDAIPELKLIVDRSEEKPQLETTETQESFHRAFVNLVRVFCTGEFPLGIFLDDLQLADPATLKLLLLIVTDPESYHLLVIGAYRDNEVSAADPLTIALQKIQQQGVNLQQINLNPLSLEDVTNLIADSFLTDRITAKPLAELVRQKTNGNPFFVKEFLTRVEGQNLISFDRDSLSWQWDLSAIAQLDITENVVNFLADKISELPANTQQVLQVAACIGMTFEVSTLATLTQSNPSAVLADLLPAIQQGIVVTEKSENQLREFSESSESEAIAQSRFNFQHEKLQTVAEFMTSAQFRNLTKLQIGRLFLQQNSPNGSNIFAIVNYYNRGIPGIQNQEEKLKLAELNLLAAHQAKPHQQHQDRSILNYLQIARKLLGTDCWQTHEILSRNIYLESIEAYYLHHKLESAENLALVWLQQAKETIDYAIFYEIKIKINLARNQMKLALETGRYVLETILGVSLIKSLEALGAKPIAAELENLPEITDSHKQIALRILIILYDPVMAIAPEMVSSIAQTMVHLCMEYGNGSEAAFAYVLYGVTLCEKMSDIELGYQFGQLALKILDKFPNPPIANLVLRLFNTKIRIVKEPAKSSLPDLKRIMQADQNLENLANAISSQLAYCFYQFFLGKLEINLSKNTTTVQGTVQGYDREKELQKHCEHIWEYIQQKFRNQFDDSHGQFQAMINFWSEAENLPDSQKTNAHRTGLFNFHLAQSILAYFFKDAPAAASHTTLAEKYQSAAVSGLAIATHNFYGSLAILAQAYNQGTPGSKTGKQTKKNLKKVRANQDKLKIWAEHAPMNFLHKYQLVEAEKARVLGQYWQAGLLYDRAIARSKKNDYIHEVALAYELAADFYWSQHLPEIAKTYVTKAHAAYVRWQGWAKVKDLESRYAEFFADSPQSRQLTRTATSTTGNISYRLDLDSILKAAQTLSSEIVLDTLLEKMMQLILENAGAQKGYLLIPKDEQWVISASGIVESNQSSLIQVQPSIPIVSDEDENVEQKYSLCDAIVNYVIRTQENLVLNNPVDRGNFTRDPYILQQQPKSILCAPLVNQGQLTGVLYLENNLATGAFTPERLEVLKLVSSQAAIALENARLYAQLEEYSRHLEQKVKQRTAELVEATNKAQAASQAKSLFLANMSHELRTPLNAILGFTQVMTRSPNIPDEHQENLSIILRSGEHLLKLINQVLDLSKIEAGRLTLNPTNFDLYRLLYDLEDMFDLKADEQRLQLIFDRSPEVPQYICTDEVKLRQVLINLLNNAIKFTEEGGVSLRVRATNDLCLPNSPNLPNLSLSNRSQQLIFEVEDTGSGIAADELKNLFQSFTQTQTGQQSQEGTGLGLAISASFVQLMGGEITVKSQVGRGTIFQFNIQVDLADSEQIQSKQPKRRIIALEPNQPRYRILIVDDREDNRQLLIKLLSPLGFELQVASNGKEAIHLWETFSPHLIWMDLRMPVMDGYQATRNIKATPKGQDTVIIALTASILEAERTEVVSAGCDDFVYKPFRHQTIFEKMAQHLGVRYIYEDLSESGSSLAGSRVQRESVPLNRDTLSVMPADWVVNLHQAALEADSEWADRLTQEIPESQASLARSLAGLLHKFQFEKIIELTEVFINEQRSN